MSTKSFFPEHKAVLSAADKQSRAVLTKFGAFVRRTAKGLIRPGKKPSKPGQPPHAHGKSPLKAFLFFVYDLAAHSVVIGPAKLGGTVSPNEPEVLEKSGTTKILAWRDGHQVLQRVHVDKRPYMGPAVAKESKKLPSLWASSVKK